MLLRRFRVCGLALASSAVLLAGPVAVEANAVNGGTPGYAITPIEVPPGAFAVGVDESTHMAYVTEAYNESLSVIDGTSEAVAASVPLGIYPRFSGIVVNPATDMIYVDGTVAGSQNGASVVKVVSGATDSVVATVSLPDGSLPEGMAVNSATDTIYVTENTQSAIAVINGATNTLSTSVNLGTNTWPDAVAVDSLTNQVYVGNNNTAALSVVDGATNTLTDTVAMPGLGTPSSVAVDAATNTIYVNVYSASGGIVRVDGATDAITGDLSGSALGGTSGTPTWALAWDPATDQLYASATYPQSGNTFVIDGSTMKIVGTIPVGAQALAIDFSRDCEYIARDTVGINLVVVTKGVSPVITSPAAVTFTTGRNGASTVTATGTPAPTFSAAGVLPRGLSFSASGRLSGTPAAFSGGRYRITITAANTVVPAAMQTLTITVDQAPSIKSGAHATFRVRRKNSFVIATRGYPVATLKEHGRLPRGIRFVVHSNGTATLSGAPWRSASGKRYVLRFTANNGIGKAAEQRFVLVIR